VDFEQGSPQPCVFCLSFTAESCLRQRDPDLLRDRPHRLGEGDVLDLLNKLENVSLFAAAKTVVILLGRVHRERRCLLFMEWAETGVILSAGLLQRDIVAYNADDVRLQLQVLREIGRERHAIRIVSQSETNRNIPKEDCCEEAVESPSIFLVALQEKVADPATGRRDQSFFGSRRLPPAFVCRKECAVPEPVKIALGVFE